MYIIYKYKNIFNILFITFFLVLYFYGANRHLNIVNTSMRRTDQGAYVNNSIRMKEKPHLLTLRNRMPLYLYIQSKFYKKGMPKAEFFRQGKYVNIMISILGLIVIYFIFRHYLNRIIAVQFWLITAFSVFIFKAGYFQAEILYYLLSFFCFLLLNKMLITPDTKKAVILGLLLGLTYLTKASIIPALILFVLVSFFQMVVRIWKKLNSRRNIMTNSNSKVLNWREVIHFFLVPAIFLLTISPYIINNKRIFGRYFYNVNTTFYMWYDSFDQAKSGTRAYNDKKQWPDMPADEIPSLKKYLREHSYNQVWARFKEGVSSLWVSMSRSYGYFKFLLLYSIFLIIIGVMRRKEALKIIKCYKWPLSFSLMFFLFYYLAYAWYVPIVWSNRLVLALFLPFIFSVGFFISKLLKDEKEELLVFSIMIGLEIYEVLSHKIVFLYGGS